MGGPKRYTAKLAKEIKKVLAKHYGYKNVKVRSDKYGWIEVIINTGGPLSYFNLKSEVVSILSKEGLWDKIGVYYDDFGQPQKKILIKSAW